MTSVVTILQNPEFWVSLAFVLVVLIAFRPLGHYLSSWGQKRAKHIEEDIQHAQALEEEAAQLLASYRKKERRKNKERAEILASAGQEIDFLWREAEQKITDQRTHKKQEAEHRLKMLQEQGHQEIKNKILMSVLQKTEQKILTHQQNGTMTENMDHTIDMLCHMLEEQAENIKRAL